MWSGNNIVLFTLPKEKVKIKFFIFSRQQMYDGPSVKEKIFKYIFHHRILGGENIFKYIFTTVFWGENIYLNIFSPPKYGSENIFKYIFSTQNTVEKIYLNIFSPPIIRW